MYFLAGLCILEIDLLGHADLGLLGVGLGLGLGLIGLRHLGFLPLALFVCLVVAPCLALACLFCLVFSLVLFLCFLVYVGWSLFFGL